MTHKLSPKVYRKRDMHKRECTHPPREPLSRKGGNQAPAAEGGLHQSAACVVMNLWAEPSGKTLWSNPTDLTHDCPLGSPGELLKLSLLRLCPDHIKHNFWGRGQEAVVFKDSPGVPFPSLRTTGVSHCVCTALYTLSLTSFDSHNSP